MNRQETESTETRGDLLGILGCPVSKGPLRYDRERRSLISEQAGLTYPVENGIPLLLRSKGRPTT